MKRLPFATVHIPLFLLVLFACALMLVPRPVRSTSGADIARGRTVYHKACAACHGQAGDGNGPAARYLDPHPRDFTLGMFKFRSTQMGMPPTDDDLYRVISEGIPTTSMPGFGGVLSESERRDVVAYIKQFSDLLGSAPAVQPITVGDAPPPTRQSVAEGKYLYMINACWTCHGPQGKGDGDASNEFKDMWGYTVRPVDFTRGRYKSGNSSRDIYRAIMTGLNGTPMPAYASSFLFGGDTVNLPSKLGDAYSTAEVEATRAYLASQPTLAEIAAMSEQEKTALAERRKWALVHFLESLARKTSLVHTLFVEDTEVTK